MPTFALGKRSSASSVNCTLTSGWRASACAQTLTSTSVTVTRTSGSSSRTRCDERVRAGHLGRDRELEDGHRPRRGQAARDRLADARQRDRLDLARRDRRSRGARGRRGLGRGALDVVGDDPAVRARAPQRREVDPALARHSPRERRGLDPAAVRQRRDAVGASARPEPRAARQTRRPRRAPGPRRPRRSWRRRVGAERDLLAASPITATVRPTGTSPEETAILSRTPEASASTSWVTLSVSSS